MRNLKPLISIFFLFSCGEKPVEPSATDAAPTAEEGVEGSSADGAVGEDNQAQPMGQEQLEAEAQNITLVPSPAEMEKALVNVGIDSALSTLVDDRLIGVDVENLDQVAVRTGVVLAQVILTVKTAPKERLVARLSTLKSGFDKLGVGDDIPGTIDDISNRIANDAVSREDLLKEVDELAGIMVPELETEVGEWVVPLIQAGSWLEGSHLVATAIINDGKFDTGSGLLRQPAVVEYFLKYVQREGGDRAPDEVVGRLEQTLVKLKEIAKKSALTQEDVNEIHSATGAVLELL